VKQEQERVSLGKQRTQRFNISLRQGLQAAGVLTSGALRICFFILSPASLEFAEITEFLISVGCIQTFFFNRSRTAKHEQAMFD
jgi:hypothetical protein